MSVITSPALRHYRNAVVDSPAVLLGDTILTATASSVSFVVPTGYDILILSWSEVYTDNGSAITLELTLVSGAGGYDYSYEPLGTASSDGGANAQNAVNLIKLGVCDNAAANLWRSNGFVTIFNRVAQEKVVIGMENIFKKGTTNTDDVVGYHIEGKDRDTSSAITKVTVSASANNFVADSRFILLGISTKDGR